MTKEEAIIWIKNIAKPYGLEYECLKIFESYCRFDPDISPDYWRHADDALYEWDI